MAFKSVGVSGNMENARTLSVIEWLVSIEEKGNETIIQSNPHIPHSSTFLDCVIKSYNLAILKIILMTCTSKKHRFSIDYYYWSDKSLGSMTELTESSK